MRPMTREEALGKFRIGWSALGYSFALMIAYTFPIIAVAASIVFALFAIVFLTVATFSPLSN